MSKPQPNASNKLKRPRGLLASRKSAGNSTSSESASKKARVDHDSPPQDPEEVKVQDWQDLEELFENALDALYGTSWTTALPLVRGVLHECARLVSVHKDPTVIYSPLEGNGSINSDNVPASAFYTIYASAWFLMATFARNDASLLTEGEPTDPLEYILSALAACEKGQQALETRQQAKAWDLELTWSRALVLAAQILVDPEESGQTSQNQPAWVDYIGPDALTALNRAFDHRSYATKHRPTTPRDEPEEERVTRQERFARVLLETAQGVLATVEGIQSSQEGQQSSMRHLSDALDLFVQVEGLPNVPPDLRAQAIFGAAQAGLAIGSSMSEELEDDRQDSGEDSDANESEEKSKLRQSAIQVLREVVERFDTVRGLSSTQKDDGKTAFVDEGEIKPLLQEALITLATLLPEGLEQESMYARYQEEGGVLDEDEDQSDESE